MPVVIRVIVVSLLFMILHMHELTLPELLYNLGMFVTGIIYSVAFIKTKNATIPLLIHLLNNAPALMLILLQSSFLQTGILWTTFMELYFLLAGRGETLEGFPAGTWTDPCRTNPASPRYLGEQQSFLRMYPVAPHRCSAVGCWKTAGH